MKLLKPEDVEKLLSDLSFTRHILNELCIIISKLLGFLRPNFETTQRNLCSKNAFWRVASPPSLRCLITHMQIYMLKPPSHFGSFGPECVFYLKNRDFS